MWYLQWLQDPSRERITDASEMLLMHADVRDSATAGRVAYALASTYDVPVHVWQEGNESVGYDVLPTGQLVVTP